MNEKFMFKIFTYKLESKVGVCRHQQVNHTFLQQHCYKSMRSMVHFHFHLLKLHRVQHIPASCSENSEFGCIKIVNWITIWKSKHFKIKKNWGKCYFKKILNIETLLPHQQSHVLVSRFLYFLEGTKGLLGLLDPQYLHPMYELIYILYYNMVHS